MKNPEQLKGAIRNLAKQQNLQAQEVLQIFLFDLQRKLHHKRRFSHLFNSWNREKNNNGSGHYSECHSNERRHS